MLKWVKGIASIRYGYNGHCYMVKFVKLKMQ